MIAGIEDPTKIGLKGSPTIVSKVFAPQPKSKKAEMIDCEGRRPHDLAVTMVTKLFTHRPDLRKSIHS